MWKRPNDVAPYPKIWRRLTVRNKNTDELYNIRIEDITPDLYDEVWDLYTEHFYPDDYVHRLLNMSADKESMATEKLFVYDHVLTQNLSVVAVLDNEDGAKRTIFGCLQLQIISKYDAPEPAPNPSLGTVNKRFFSFLSSLRKGVNVFEKLETDFLLKEMGLVVKREYRGMGVGRELFRTMECIAKTFNIPAAIAILGNSISQKIGASLGIILLKEGRVIDSVDENGQKFLPTADSDKIIQWGYFRYT